MAGKTISAYVEEGIAARVDHLAKVEDRSPGQISGAAVRLYTTLPAEARTAVRVLEAYASPEEIDWAMREVTRALLRVRLAVIDRKAGEEAEKAGAPFEGNAA